MRPLKGQKRFKIDTRYPHNRSDGMTSRRNGGSVLQPVPGEVTVFRLPPPKGEGTQ